MAGDQTIVDRIKLYRDIKGFGKSEFEKLCSLSNGYFNGVKTPSADKLENILLKCPDLNRSWVLTGKGEMLISKPTDSRQTENNEVNKDFKRCINKVKFEFSITQKEIANRIGVHNTYLSDMINGRVPLTDHVLNKIHELFHIGVGAESVKNMNSVNSNITEILSEPTSEYKQLIKINDLERDELRTIIKRQNELLDQKDLLIEQLRSDAEALNNLLCDESIRMECYRYLGKKLEYETRQRKTKR